VHDASGAFFHVAVDSWHSLQTTAQDGRVRLNDFLDTMKHKLGATWNDRLVDPARSFFTTVQKETQEKGRLVQDKGHEMFAAIKSKLGTTWEQTVKKNLTLDNAPESVQSVARRVSQPAEHFYRYGLEAYRNLATSANGAGVSFTDFLATLRGRLGSAWNSALTAPAQYLYDYFRGEKFHDDELKSEEGDVPANTASPMPTSLDQIDSLRGSGANTPDLDHQHVLYPTETGDGEDVVLDESGHGLDEAHEEFPAPVVTAVKAAVTATAAAVSKSASKKKKGGKKKSAAAAVDAE